MEWNWHLIILVISSNCELRLPSFRDAIVNKTDDGFRSYFNNYAWLLPVLSSKPDPDLCYASSPVLFWAIVMVGSRRYLKNPTLLGTVSPRVRDLALASLGTGQPSLPSIKGALIILTWPGPVDSKSIDTSFRLAGLLIHSAMQIGLHMPTASQDFSRIPIKTTDQDIRKRSRIWAYCVLLYHRYWSGRLLAVDTVD